MSPNTNNIGKLDFLYSRPLDVHRWSDYSEVNTFVDDVYQVLKSLSGHEKTSKKLVKVLLLDLYVAWSSDPNLMIMFSRNNNSYKARSRYSELHVGKAIIGIVDALVNEGIIHEKRGFNDRVSGTAFQSRLWSSDWLELRFKEAKFSQFMIEPHEYRETIILRNADKEDEEYEDTEETIRMRQVLKDYNELLSNTHIDILDLEVPVIEIGTGKKKMRLQINQQDKFVRRIFNNSRWDQGGRFYGGWWQRCPSERRVMIEFDGIATAELDYSGIHIVILYAQVGINYWKDINEDPYKIDDQVKIDGDIDLRKVAKLLLLTALNAENEDQAFRAFRFQSETGSSEKGLTNEQLSSILIALKEKHKPLLISWLLVLPLT